MAKKSNIKRKKKKRESLVLEKWVFVTLYNFLKYEKNY